jgi:hypothetical protein
VKNLIISPKIAEKLSKKDPPVTRREVEQCFENICGGLLVDTREQHKTNPPTLWFIARTNANRELKIAYVLEAGLVYLKSAFDPNDEERRIYLKHAC